VGSVRRQHVTMDNEVIHMYVVLLAFVMNEVDIDAPC
jgi:hypothetical protein